MPIPVSSTLLFAVASLAIIAGRFLHIRIHRQWGLLLFTAVILISGFLPEHFITNANSTPRMNNGIAFIDDALARSEQWLVLAFGFLAGIAVVDAYRNEHSTLSLYGFLLVAAAGLTLVARANDFLSLGLSLEIVDRVLVALRQHDRSHLILIANTKRRTNWRTAEDWHLWLASAWMWIGAAILASATNTTNFGEFRAVMIRTYESMDNQTALGTPSTLILLGTGLVAMSLFARMGLAPFQLGFRTQWSNHCTALTAYSVLAQQFAGTMALTRLFGITFVGLDQMLTVLVMTISLTSFMASLVVAVRGHSSNVKSISYWIASLTLLQSAWFGVILMAALNELEHPDWRWGAFDSQAETLAICVYVQLANMLSSCGIYWTLGHLARVDRDATYLEDFKGLIQFAPGASLALLVAMASAIGAPFTAGFWGRWMMLLSGYGIHLKVSNSVVPHAGLRMVLFAGAVATIPIAVVVIRLAREMFLELPLAQPKAIGGQGSLIASAIAVFTILSLGVAPQFVMTPLQSIQVPRNEKQGIHQKGSGNVPMSQYKRNASLLK